MNEFYEDPCIENVIFYLESVLRKMSSTEIMDVDDYAILIGETKASIVEAVGALKEIKGEGNITE